MAPTSQIPQFQDIPNQKNMGQIRMNMDYCIYRGLFVQTYNQEKKEEKNNV
jgi:hypothetical protein